MYVPVYTGTWYRYTPVLGTGIHRYLSQISKRLDRRKVELKIWSGKIYMEILDYLLTLVETLAVSSVPYEYGTQLGGFYTLLYIKTGR